MGTDSAQQTHKSRHSLPPSPLEDALASGAEISPDVWTAEFGWLIDMLNTANTGWGTRGSGASEIELCRYRMAGFLTVSVGGFSARGFDESADTSTSGGECYTHANGKRMAAWWISRLGGCPVIEASMYGGRVDVFCSMLGIAVEVGSLAPSRLLQMLEDEAVQRAIVLPFSHELQSDQPPSVPFLEFRMELGWEVLRDIIRDEKMGRARAAVAVLEYD